MKSTDNEKGIISAVVKASDILDCFTAEEPVLSLAQISSRISLPKSSVLNLLRTLEYCGLICRIEDNKNYCLGYRTLTLSHAKRQALPMLRQALPELEELQERSGEIVYLVTHAKGKVLYLEGLYPGRRMAAYSVAGKTNYMHCTSVGKSILAYLPQEEIDAILDHWGLPALTANTTTDRDKLMEELAQIRQQGYAVDNEEETLGVRCVGVPIRNRNGYPTGAISISSTVLALTDDHIPRYAEQISRVCARLSPLADQLLHG